MFFIKFPEQVELLPLFGRGNRFVLDVLDQLFDLFVLGIDVSPLINSRQERTLPILRFLTRLATGAHRNETWQVLVGRAKAISDPGTHTGPRQARLAAIHQQERWLTVRDIGMHRANHRDIINVLRDVWEQVAYLDSALAVLIEF